MKIYSTKPASVKMREYRAKTLEERKKYARDYYKSNPEKHRLWHYNSALKRCYGLSLEVFNQMWEGQEGKCACCLQEMKRGGQKSNCACVDHDHATGKVRAIICRECNLGIAHFRETPERCELAADYLRKYRPSNSGLQKVVE